MSEVLDALQCWTPDGKQRGGYAAEWTGVSSSHSTFYGATQPVLSGVSQGALMKGQTKQACLKLVTEDVGRGMDRDS